MRTKPAIASPSAESVQRVAGTYQDARDFLDRQDNCDLVSAERLPFKAALARFEADVGSVNRYTHGAGKAYTHDSVRRIFLRAIESVRNERRSERES